MIGEKEPVLSVSLFAMLEAMRRVLARLPEEGVHHQVPMQRITLRERMTVVMDLLHDDASAVMLFEDLLTDGQRSRHWVVMTFLAILELVRIQVLHIFQNVGENGEPIGPVRVRLAVEPDAIPAQNP
jgi:chromatin segregation and condensation protein Rec8/ScpA/Scc1 (kleisin family)